MKKIEVKKLASSLQEKLKALRQKLQPLKDRASNLDEKQKKKAIIVGSFILLLTLSLASDFLGALIPIALVSYMLSQVGGVREELKKLKNGEAQVEEKTKEDN